MKWWQTVVRPIAWAVLVLVVARIGLRAALHSVTQPAGSEGDVPAAQFEILEKKVGVSSAEGEVEADFTVRNAGRHRLVVQLLRRACCDPPAQGPLLLAPGASGTLTVRAPAADLLKHGQFRQALSTNDPRNPELWLTLKLAGDSTQSAPPTATTGSRPADRSVLVKRP